MVLTGFLFLTMFITIFLATTAPNRTWNKAKRALLNDASLCPAVLAAFGPHPGFDRFLDGHELAACNMLGLAVTTRRMARAISVVAPSFALVVYLMLRSTLQTGSVEK